MTTEADTQPNYLIYHLKIDKSEEFKYTVGENGAPLIDDAKVSIECEMNL